jgi:predicted aminopeptidase
MAVLAADASRAQRTRADFRAMIISARARLTALYAGTAGDEEKRAGKAALFAELRAENERQKTAPGGAPTFDRWFAAGANNAGVVAASLYADRVPQFKSLLEAEDGDFVRFYRRVKALAAVPKAKRELALAEAVRH